MLKDAGISEFAYISLCRLFAVAEVRLGSRDGGVRGGAYREVDGIVKIVQASSEARHPALPHYLLVIGLVLRTQALYFGAVRHQSLPILGFRPNYTRKAGGRTIVESTYFFENLWGGRKAGAERERGGR